MADRYYVHRFAIADLPDANKVEWIDAVGVRVYFARVSDGRVLVAVGKAGEAPPADLEFVTPSGGQGKASQLQAYLAAIRAQAEPDWEGIGNPDDQGRWGDPAEVGGLPGYLAQHVAMFDKKTPL